MPRTSGGFGSPEPFFTQVIDRVASSIREPFKDLDPFDLDESDLERSFWKTDFWNVDRKEPEPDRADEKFFRAGENYSRWMRQHSNGKIPQSALAPLRTQQGHFARPDAAEAFDAMVRAAKRDGVRIGITDSYRTYERQVSLKAEKPTLAATPGTSNHGWGLAFDIIIDPRVHAWLVKNAKRFGYANPFGNSYYSKENWHWEYKGGFKGKVKKKPEKKEEEKKVKRPKPKDERPALTRGRTDATYDAILPHAMLSTLMPKEVIVGGDEEKGERQGVRNFKGPGGPIKKQLYAGFMAAGRRDLAKMVGTKAFNTWVSAESGWNPNIVSPANNQGMVNGGLFQFWYGHGWARKHFRGGNSQSSTFTATPFQQAKFVAQHFSHLTPDRIRQYAAQIRAGAYPGWG